MHGDALSLLLYCDTHNTSLCHSLSPWLTLTDLTTLAHACRAFRSWVRDAGKGCFLGVTPLRCADVPVLSPWNPHFFLDGVATVSKRHSLMVLPRLYSCFAHTVKGEPMLEGVPRGAGVDPQLSTIQARLLHATTNKCVEKLGRVPLFKEVKPPKGEEELCYDFRRIYFKIATTLTSNYTTSTMFRLHVKVAIALRNTHMKGHYCFTSDRFRVVSTAPPPHKRKRAA